VTHNEPIAVPVNGLVERARGSRAGGEESAADPRKFKSTGGGRREAEPKAEVEARQVLASRGRFGNKGQRDAAAEPGGSGTGTGLGLRYAVAETIKRSMKNPGGGNRDDSESIKLGSPSGNRREAAPETVNGLEVAAGSGCPRDAAPIKFAADGCRRDAAPQPGRLDIGKGHDVRPGGGTRISRGLRGNGANPRGVRPGNGNNQRDITAETVEARGRFRGISSPA